MVSSLFFFPFFFFLKLFKETVATRPSIWILHWSPLEIRVRGNPRDLKRKFSVIFCRKIFFQDYRESCTHPDEAEANLKRKDFFSFAVVTSPLPQGNIIRTNFQLIPREITSGYNELIVIDSARFIIGNWPGAIWSGNDKVGRLREHLDIPYVFTGANCESTTNAICKVNGR